MDNKMGINLRDSVVNGMKSNSTKKYLYQASTQLVSNFVILIINFLINIVVSREIPPDVFGEYRFVISYVMMIPSIIHLGYANSVGRLTAKSQENEQGNISGYGFTIISIFAFIFILISMPLMSILINSGTINVSWYAVYFTPFIFLTTMQLIVQTILIGQNRIIALSSFNLIPQILLFITITVLLFIFKLKNTLALLIPYVVINGLAIIYRIYMCKPARVKITESFLALNDENKNFGFKVYIGSIFGVVIGQLVGLISGSLVGMEQYGLFSLAFSFVTPFQMLASTLGTVLYKSNITRKKISSKLFAGTIAINLVAYFIFYVTIEKVFVAVFSIGYTQSLNYMKILALYGICLGLGDFINRFLGAKGSGRMLMIGAILTGIVLAVLSYVLIPSYKIDGLIYAYLFSGIVYLISMITSYIIYQKSVN